MKKRKFPFQSQSRGPAAAAAAAPAHVSFEFVDGEGGLEISGSCGELIRGRFGTNCSRLSEAVEYCRARGWRVELPPRALLRLLIPSKVPAPLPDPDLLTRLPEKMRSRLKEHQRSAIRDFTVKFDRRVLLCDDPGLGKSAQSLGMVLSGGARRILVVCPSSICENWCEEISKWTDLTARVLREPRHLAAAQEDDPDVLIVAYDAIGIPTRLLFEAVCRQRTYCAVIADECHRIRNYSAKRTQTLALDELSPLQKSPMLVLISGTPFVSQPIQLYPTTSCRNRNIISQKEFGERYCDAHFVSAFGGVDDTGKSHQRELEVYLRRQMIRRRACEIPAMDLPPKVREIRRVPFPSLQEKMGYYRLEIEFHDALTRLQEAKQAATAADGAGWLVAQAKRAKQEAQRLKSALLRMAGALKVTRATEMILEEIGRLPPEEHVLVFAHHELVRSRVKEMMLAAGHSLVEIDGKTPQPERLKRMRQVADPASPIRVGILSITAAGEGLNATPAVTLSCFLELVWNPASHDQAEARGHRLGATKPQRAVYYVLEGDTVEDSVLRKHREKTETTSFCLNGRESVQREFALTEIDSDLDDSDDEEEP